MELKTISPERIIAAACIHFEISEAELKSRHRYRDISYRRKICYYLMRENCCISFERIAMHFGFRDHKRVSRAICEIEAQKHLYTHISPDLINVKNIAVNLLTKQVKNG